MRLLICGVPGSGKTTFGNWLRDNHGYTHYDLERELYLGITQEPNAVVTWGYAPDCIESKKVVLKFIKAGYLPVWFGGDWEHSYNRYAKRTGTSFIDGYRYFTQIKKILAERPDIGFQKKINPFDENGEFKNPEDILKQIL